MSLPRSSVPPFSAVFVPSRLCGAARGGAAPAGRGGGEPVAWTTAWSRPLVEPVASGETELPGRRRCPSLSAVEAVRGGGESTLVGEHRLAETEPSDAGLFSYTRDSQAEIQHIVRPFLSQRPSQTF